jgi:hypothetical protein
LPKQESPRAQDEKFKGEEKGPEPPLPKAPSDKPEDYKEEPVPDSSHINEGNGDYENNEPLDYARGEDNPGSND